MQRFQFVGLSLILLTGACASTSGRRASQSPPDEPIRGAVAEFQVTSYDGQALRGRVLIGATIDPLVVDGRFIPSVSFNLDQSTLRMCGMEKPIDSIDNDLFVRTPRPEDILTLRPGYWYGATFEYWLFPRAKPGPLPGPGEEPGPTGGPECIEGEFVVRALSGRPVARVRFHAVRNDKLPAPSDRGAPPVPAAPKPVTPEPPTPGAGTP